MTVTSTVRKAGPFAGNNAATTFPFSFKVFAKGDIKTLRVSPSGTSTQLTLDSDYSVQLNTNQDSQPGGWVTYPISGSPLATGYELVMLGDLPYDQETDITNQGGFYPSVIEDMSDRSTIQIQQLAEITSRAIVVSEVESVSPVLPNAQTRSNTMLGFDAVGNVALLPLPSAIGAGDRVPFTLVAGTDFNAGDTHITLPQAPGTAGNIELFFDANFQGFDQWSVNGAVLTFVTPIPAGVTKIFGYIGTVLSTEIPPAGSIGADQLIDGSVTDTKLSASSKVAKLAVSTRDLTFYSDSVVAGDWAPAIWAALDDMPSGSTIEIPWFSGGILVNSARNNAVWDFTPYPNKAIRIVGKGWSLKNGGSFSFGTNAGPMGSVFRIGAGIASTTDFYHQAPTDLIIGGVGFYDFAVAASTGAYGTPHGQNGFNIDGTANANGYIENLVMDNVFIDNFAAGSSILVNGIGNAQGVLAGAEFRNSKFMNFYAPGFGDSNTIRNNVIGANAGVTGAVGINFYNVSGATNTRILNNDMVNFNGMILCNGATKLIIDGNEFEQPDGFANSLGAMISLNGANGAVDTPTITNNSIAQNSAIANYIPLVVGNSNGAKISGNRISTLSAYNQIQINNNSSYALLEADNQSWVNGVVQDGVAVLDNGVKSMLRACGWTAYTPVVSASTGAFTSVTATGAYQLIDTRTLKIRMSIVINTVGTASGTVNATLPGTLTAAALQAVGGKETAATGKGLSGDITLGSGTIAISDAAGVSIIGAGNQLVISGTIEIQ